MDRYPEVINLIKVASSLLLTFILIPSHSQNQPQVNLVPNPGFEEFSDKPGGWYFSGRDFSRVSLYWTSPNAASPDIFAPGVEIPPSWKAVGFGNTKSYEGKTHAGITVYGCDQGKPHCREYIQVQLSEPLVPGQRYGFSCMLSQLQKSVTVRNIGLSFSEHEVDEIAHEPILITPSLELDRWIPSDGKWHRWSGHFVADKAVSYMIIGNFHKDAETHIKMPWRSKLRYGYYYVDDVRLFKIPPIIKVPLTVSPLAGYIPKEGGIINLSRIYFEHDRTDFMPQALIQLKQLFDFLQKYPDIKLEVRGHTDNVGSPEYNQHLSERRAKAVRGWLIEKGIAADRLTYAGLGSHEPLDSNDHSKGRSQNRRVEVKIISL